MRSPRCSAVAKIIAPRGKQQVQLFSFVQLTHLGLHANEDSIVFSSTSPDGRIGLKGKLTFAGVLKQRRD